MRNFVIGDIHGGLLALEEILLKAKVSTNDTLIFLGDYVDGWSQSPQLLDFLIDLNTSHTCIFIRGNHDELVLRWLKENKKSTDNQSWYKHGGEATVLAYKNVSDATKQKHIFFLENLLDYYIDEENRLFIHAGFTNVNGVLHEYFPKLYYWDRTLWETALSLDNRLEKNNPLYPSRFLLYSEIYIGHTPVTRINQTIPVQKACVWNIDTGAAFKGPLTILDVATKQFWQSTPVYQLYKDEQGRN